MRIDELIRGLLFLWAVSLVYLYAATVLFARIRRRRSGRHAAPFPGLERSILTTAAVGLLCMTYGYFVEPYWPDVAHVRVPVPPRPGGAAPLRVVHISDLHCDVKQRLESRLPALIAAQSPDLIVFTGDALNTGDALPAFRGLLTRLSGIAPTFVVRGNWDAWYWHALDLFGGTGATELDGTGASLEARGRPVWVGGVAVGHEDRLPALLSSRPPGALSILLYHTPDQIDAVAAAGIDLYCAGHTHGGQVALPFYGALVTLSKFGKRFEAGAHRVGKTTLYVNRGIGMEGGGAPRVRFCARPEVTVLEVSP